jgi:hypothetical protein
MTLAIRLIILIRSKPSINLLLAERNDTEPRVWEGKFYVVYA